MNFSPFCIEALSPRDLNGPRRWSKGIWTNSSLSISGIHSRLNLLLSPSGFAQWDIDYMFCSVQEPQGTHRKFECPVGHLNCLHVYVVYLWVQGLGQEIPSLIWGWCFAWSIMLCVWFLNGVCNWGRITVHICVEVNNPPPLQTPILLSFLPPFYFFYGISLWCLWHSDNP